MNQLIALFCTGLLIWFIIQSLLMLFFLRYLRSYNSKSLAVKVKELPKTAVILSLRGADPYLSKCLRSLFQQNYPNYDIKLIVDSEEDPAWKVAIKTVAEEKASNVEIQALKHRRKTCTLKCSSLVQALSTLDKTYKVVALVDADTVAHSNWLRELVSPLSDPKVAATTGNRWYLPTGQYWGTLVRYIWNTSAVVQMFLYGIPWGGTLAIKTEVIRKTGLLEKWKHSYTDDTMISRVMQKHGYQVKFVPSLLIVNREETNLPRLLPWIRRQLFISRLYHPLWPAVVGDSILTIVLPNLVLGLFFISFFIGQGQAAILALIGYCSYLFGLLALILTLEKSVRQVISRRGEVSPRFNKSKIWKIFVGTPFTQWFYFIALVSCHWMPIVNWRGINYQIKGPFKIRMMEYRPYKWVDQPIDPKISL